MTLWDEVRTAFPWLPTPVKQYETRLVFRAGEDGEREVALLRREDGKWEFREGRGDDGKLVSRHAALADLHADLEFDVWRGAKSSLLAVRALARTTSYFTQYPEVNVRFGPQGSVLVQCGEKSKSGSRTPPPQVIFRVEPDGTVECYDRIGADTWKQREGTLW